MSSTDPRIAPEPVERVPELLVEGAEHYSSRRFWHAHEAWETAWHALRGAGRSEEAGFVRGMILVTAAFENATRDKEPGHKRQMAEGLHALLQFRAAGMGLVKNADAWTQSLLALYVDACRRRRWAAWNESGWVAPPLEL